MKNVNFKVRQGNLSKHLDIANDLISMKAKTQQLLKNSEQNIEHISLVSRIARLILQSSEPELDKILGTTTTEVRNLLETDRVKVYKFHPDQSGQVVAESIQENKLPSLLGLNFPADDIPNYVRDLYTKSGACSIINFENQLIGFDLKNSLSSPGDESENLDYRPIGPCHLEYLTAMGVKYSLVIPILINDQLWGLLVSHHTEALDIPKWQIEEVKEAVNYLCVAIAQASLLAQAREKGQQDATINNITTYFGSLPNLDLQKPLEETVKAFGGSGGRLYIATSAFELQPLLNDHAPSSLNPDNQGYRLFVTGNQPTIPEHFMYPVMEQYSCWSQYFQSGEHQVWPINHLYQTPQLRNLQLAFDSSKICGILVVPLRCNGLIVGFLSIFRDEMDTETLWAGEFDPDVRQEQPRQSFTVWKQLKKGQIEHWTDGDAEMLKTLGIRFSSAIQQHEMCQQVQKLNHGLEKQVKERTTKLRQAKKQQQILFDVVTKMRDSLDIETIFDTMSRGVRVALEADRVGIYRFDPQSEFNEGAFVAEDVASGYSVALGAKVKDHCFGENYANLYTQGRINTLDDIHAAGLQDCYVAVLDQFQIKASLTAPVLKGEKLWGLLCIHQCSKPRHWQESEIQFARQISSHVSIALEQAHLLTQTKKSAEQEKALFEVVTKIRQSLDLEVIFKVTTREIRQLLQAERVTIYKFDPHWGGKFLNNFESSAPEWQDVGRMGEDLVWDDTYLQKNQGGCYQHNHTFSVSNVHRGDLTQCHIDVLDQFQIKAFATAPIFVGQKLWGVMAAYHHSKPRHWTDSEVNFLAHTAAQLGVAIQQSDLLSQTQDQAQQLQHTLQELKEAQTQLIQTEKMSSLGQLVAGIAHEINNPVNFIHGNLVYAGEYVEELLELVNLYREHYPETNSEIAQLAEKIEPEFLSEDLQNVLSSMKVGTERIRQIIVSLLNFSRLDQANLKAVNIHEGIDSSLLILHHRLKGKSERQEISIVKEYGDLPLVECYAGQLNQVFMNLLSNSIYALDDYGQSQPNTYVPQIKISTDVIKNNGSISGITIAIADNGPGIPEEAQTKILEPFFTTKPVGKGTGLGLSISYQIVVDKHRGSMKCESQPGEGTRFYLEIPLEQSNR